MPIRSAAEPPARPCGQSRWPDIDEKDQLARSIRRHAVKLADVGVRSVHDSWRGNLSGFAASGSLRQNRKAEPPVMTGARTDLLFTMSDNTRPPRLSAMRARNHFYANELDWCAFAPPSEATVCRSRRRRVRLVEPDGIEPTTSCLQSRRSPS
jgi:hypothetical protein